MFAIEFNDGCPVHVSIPCSLSRFTLLWFGCFICLSIITLLSFLFQVYASTSRDSLLAAVRDVLQTEVGGCAFSWILYRFTFCGNISLWTRIMTICVPK